MSTRLTLRDVHDMDMADQMANVQQCKALLSRLPVGDLRILARRYWRMDAAELRTIGKADLVNDLSTENCDEILDDMWRHRRGRRAS